MIQGMGKALLSLLIATVLQVGGGSISFAAESISSVTSMSSSEGSLSTHISDIFKNRKPGRSEFYSEGFYYTDFEIVNETRVRYYQPFFDNDTLKLEAYFGVSYQSQSLSAKQKIVDNNVLPAGGVRGQLFNTLNFMVQTGVMHFTDEAFAGEKAQQDTRIALGADRFIEWNIPHLFTEGSVEFAQQPRLDPYPALNVWAREGARFRPHHTIILDPYGEVNTSQQPTGNSAATSFEYRMGLRTQYQNQNWNLVANVFHPVGRKDAHGEIDGLLSAEGQF